MKKLMTMIGAVAMAFGLFADPLDPGFRAGTAFEANDGGNSYVDSQLSANFWVLPAEGTATVSEGTHDRGLGGDRPANFITAANVNNMKVATTLGNPVLHYAVSGGAMGLPIASEGSYDGLYFDSLVKFTLFDPEDAPTADGAKIAVYPQLVSDADGAKAYLTVLAKDNGVTNRYVTATEIAADTWYRLTIKAIADIDGKGQTGFMVFVNGAAVADVDYAKIQSGLLPKYDEWGKDGKIFLSMVDSDATVKSVGFDGKGEVDEIAFTTTAPDFAVDPAMYKADWSAINGKFDTVSVDGEEVTDATELAQGFAWRTIPQDGTAVISWTGKDDYMDGSKELAVVDDDEFALEASDAKQAIALVDTAKFDDLNEAVAAAADKTLTLLANATNLTIAADMTLDLNGWEIAGFNVAGTANLIIDDDSEQAGTINGDVSVAASAALTIKAGTFEGAVTTLDEEEPWNITIEDGNAKFNFEKNMDDSFGDPECTIMANLPEGKVLVADADPAAYWVLGEAKTEIDTLEATAAYGDAAAVIVVKAGDVALTLDEDYKITENTYENTLSAGAKFSVTVEGTGSYKGEITWQFTVAKASAEAAVTLTTTTGVYGEVQDLPTDYTVTINGAAAAITDYDVAWDKTLGNVGEYTLTVSAAEGGNYTFEAATATFTLTKATPVITAPLVATEVEAGTALKDITFTTAGSATGVGGETVNGAFAWSNGETQVQETGAFDVTFTPTSENYAAGTCQVTVTVKAAGPIIDPTNGQTEAKDVEAPSDTEAAKKVIDAITAPKADDMTLDDATYQGYFKATAVKGSADGKWDVTLELDETKVSPDTTMTEAAASLSDVIAGTATAATVTNAKVGLYYSFKYADEVATVKGEGAAEGDRVLAKSAEVEIPMPKDASKNARFWVLNVSTTATPVNQD